MKKLFLVLLSLSVLWSDGWLEARPGELRRDFGDDGVLVLDIRTDDAFADLIAHAGSQLTVSTQDWQNGIFRLSYEGVMDVDFGNRGFFEGSGATRLALQRDGKLILGQYYGLVRRLDVDGNLDSAFSFMPPSSYTGFLTTDVLIQPDNKILVLGQEREENSPLEIHRLLPDGSYDVSFGVSGIFTALEVEGGILPARLALQRDGKIILTASKINDAVSSQFFVGRLHGNGTWDTDFGPHQEGYTRITFRENRNERVGDVLVQPDGKIVVSGGVWLEDMIYSKYLATARLTRKGRLDYGWNSFDHSGKVVIPTNFRDTAMIYKMVLQPDGKILYVASDLPFWRPVVPFELSRLRSDGSFDRGFGLSGTGRVLQSGRLGSALDMEWDEDCSVVVGGNTDYQITTGERGTTQNIFLARFETGFEPFCSFVTR